MSVAWLSPAPATGAEPPAAATVPGPAPAASPVPGPAPAATTVHGPAATAAGSPVLRADPDALRPAAGVRDPVFAVLLGFVLDNHVGDLDSTRVRAEVERIPRKPKLPYRWIEVITRRPVGGPAGSADPRSIGGSAGSMDPPSAGGPTGSSDPPSAGGHARSSDPSSAGAPDPPEFAVSSVFDRVIDVGVPYQILGYHPGSFRGSRRLDFRELDLGARDIAYPVQDGDRVALNRVSIDDARLYILESGMLEIDIDGWLDRLAGSKLDDTRVAGLVVFRKDGALYGMALGYNPDGEPRSGTISFGEDKILYPNPTDLKAVARQIRHEMETYAPTLAAKYRGWK